MEGVGNRMLRNSWDPGFTDFQERVTHYEAPDMRRWHPGSLEHGIEIVKPRDFVMTTTQRTITIMVIVEFVEGLGPEGYDEEFYVPSVNGDGVENR